MLNKIILSPPFSNIYPNIKGSTRITGTYTLNRRRGMYRVVTSLRKTKNGWLNNVGLRNPGIINYNKENSIISVSLQDLSEWDEFFEILQAKSFLYNILGIEFNISCPNHDTVNINNEMILQSKRIFKNTIIKMPHNSSLDFIEKICDTDIDILHISNSQKTSKGGLSGKSLINNNLIKIHHIKENFNKKVIAGGGIYSFKEILDYKSVGADYFSLGTCLINPFRTLKIIKKMSQYQ